MSLDLSAAFDCVPHAILKEKLEFYGLDDLTREWIHSYLDNRSSFVAIGSAESDIEVMDHGVPQGSVLGPMLYLLFVNEMTAVIEDDNCVNIVHGRRDVLFTSPCQECGIFPIYADDGQYQIASNSRDHNQDWIEMNFWRIRSFLNSNGLQVNESKTTLTELMVHQKRSRTRGIPPDLTVRQEVTDRNGRVKMEDTLLTDSGYCRMLGLNIKNNLTWDAHLNTGKKALLPAMRSRIGMLHRLGNNISMKARLQLVNSLVMSRVIYMICIWGNTCSSQIKKVQTLQNLAARLVTGARKTDRQNDTLKKCQWMNIRNLTTYHSLCQLWKTVWWRVPVHLDEKITRLPDNRLQTVPPRLLQTSWAYRWKTIQNWNDLPDSLRSEPSLVKFKTCLKRLLKDRQDEDCQDRLTQEEDRPGELNMDYVDLSTEDRDLLRTTSHWIGRGQWHT